MEQSVIPIKTVGKRGKDKVPRKKRNDSSINTGLSSDERMNILQHNIKIAKLPRINPNDPEALAQRIEEYFTVCANDSLCPAVAGFALALGIDRRTLWTWITETTGTIKNPLSLDLLKNAYSIINSQYEYMLNGNKINPVSAIFLLKNNMGYKDQTDHVLTARQDIPESESDIVNRAGLLTD